MPNSTSPSIHTVHLPNFIPSTTPPLSPELLAESLTHLHRDGILILANAINTSHLASLEEVLLPEATQIAQDPNHHFNFGRHTRNMDQAPPLAPSSLLFEDIWANPFAVAVLQCIMGPELVCHYANGNTALPNQSSEGRQPVHSDVGGAHPLFPFAYAINVPLCDVDVENGATEVWPGSHRDSCVDQHVGVGGGGGGGGDEADDDGEEEEGDLRIKPTLVEERRKYSPPTRAVTKKGSLIIRDLRLWHAGMPNRTSRPRIMLAFVVQPKWFQAPSRVLLPLKVKEIVDGWRARSGLEYHAQWVDVEVDHKKVLSDDVDFNSKNKRMLELEELMHFYSRQNDSE